MEADSLLKKAGKYHIRQPVILNDLEHILKGAGKGRKNSNKYSIGFVTGFTF